MKKILAICGALLLSVCALSACGDGTPKYEVTEEEWRSAFSDETIDNVTVKVLNEVYGQEQSVEGTFCLDGNKISYFTTFYQNGTKGIQEGYIEKTAEKYRAFTREYSAEAAPPQWKMHEADLSDMPSWIATSYSAIRVFGKVYADRYSDFTFDGDKTYAAENFQMPNVSFSGGEIIVSEGTSTVPVSMRFENSRLVFCSVNGLQYSFSEYGTTVVTMPDVNE